jgi:DNA primase catalytic core
VDFRTAIKDLGERTGVRIEEGSAKDAPKKDEKDRVRDCLSVAASYFSEQLKQSVLAQQYLKDRDVPKEQIDAFQIGYAPDSFSQTYEHLLKSGYSRKEILASGMGIQKDLKEERIYDRFRNRLMFPIHDQHGSVIAFGGRTLGEDDAKYINSSESILFHKSSVLFGLHHAKEPIRKLRKVILVEGYFDLLACQRVGVEYVVATCGTALTEQHVSVLKRYVDTVELCLDSDRAGREAAERAFLLLSSAGMNVRTIVLPLKDASELLQKESLLLKTALTDGGLPYIDAVLEEIRSKPLTDPAQKRDALQRMLTLITVLPFAVERRDYLMKCAGVFSTTESALEEDLRSFAQKSVLTQRAIEFAPLSKHPEGMSFSKAEIVLGLFLLYPKFQTLLSELIEPQDPFASALYKVLKAAVPDRRVELEEMDLPQEYRERASILVLFCEQHGFLEWSESLAIREIRKNCLAANREALKQKLEILKKDLLQARNSHNATDEALLLHQYQQVIKLMKTAS